MATAENIVIDENIVKSGKLVFSGTDNGIIQMSATAQVTMNMLKQIGISIDADIDFSFKLPKTFVIYSRDIYCGSGGMKLASSLEKSKRGNEGKKIKEMEEKMKDLSLPKAKAINEIDTMYKKHMKGCDLGRKFYFSEKRNKQKRQYMYKKRKYVDCLLTRERKHVSGKQEDKLIMCIGDRGYGTGSHIKGHLKYGGTWEPKKHSLYTTVAITSEHNTSQA